MIKVGGVAYTDDQAAVAQQVYECCLQWARQTFGTLNQGAVTIFAIAAVANADRETSLNPKARGDNDTAGGLWQWHAERRNRIKSATGCDVWDGTVESALAGMRYELGPGGGYHGAGLTITACSTPEDASESWCRDYEVAGAGNAVNRSRALATAWAAYFSRLASFRRRE